MQKLLSDETFWKFLAVGAVTTLFDLGFFSMLIGPAALNAAWANLCSYSSSVVLSFGLNRFWTFQSLDTEHGLGSQAVRFAASNVAGLMLSTVAVLFLSRFLPDLIAKIASIPAVLVWNFTLARFWVFRRPKQ